MAGVGTDPEKMEARTEEATAAVPVQAGGGVGALPEEGGGTVPFVEAGMEMERGWLGAAAAAAGLGASLVGSGPSSVLT